MAEGLYSLLHQRIGMSYAISDYWQVFLDSRMEFLEAVLSRCETAEPGLRNRIASSIEIAMVWSQRIEPAMCEHYIRLWKKDLVTWEQRLRDVPRLSSVKAALRELDLIPPGRNSYFLSRIIGEAGVRSARMSLWARS
jgi:hypothetical protein